MEEELSSPPHSLVNTNHCDDGSGYQQHSDTSGETEITVNVPNIQLPLSSDDVHRTSIVNKYLNPNVPRRRSSASPPLDALIISVETSQDENDHVYDRQQNMSIPFESFPPSTISEHHFDVAAATTEIAVSSPLKLDSSSSLRKPYQKSNVKSRLDFHRGRVRGAARNGSVNPFRFVVYSAN